MFIDAVTVKLTAGRGGDGIVAWRREKYIPKGGPYGGNGGRGGSIILMADTNELSLENFRHIRSYFAENGKPGGPNSRQGRTGENLILKVPFGTIVKDKKTKEILFDFTPEEKEWTICKGGKGGKGNVFFKSPTNQAPNIATPGLLGETIEVDLELKLIADVGLVGMPNAGKSTLLSKITKANVKIGAYPFTTLHPNLSYIENEDLSRIFIADIPGIIENAHLDKGLGLSFLKHIERTKALVYVIDISGEEGRDPFEDFQILQKELKEYKNELLDKPFVVVLNKIDLDKSHLDHFKKSYPFDPKSLIEISALQEEGLTDLVEQIRLTILKN
ncbi:MAG: GTPase ObgE [Chlamydiae bacterium]|nr:GTPase ObgE [Chlamydiota bacterium]